ncbi:MAG: PAS domain S-box protein, partial [Methanobacteriota archaeon]
MAETTMTTDINIIRNAIRIPPLPAEGADRRQSDLLTLLFDQILDATVILDWDGTVLFTNRAGAALIGLKDPDEAVGMNILSVLHPDSAPAAVRDLQLVREGKGGFLNEYRIRTLSGEEKWVEGLGTKITIEGITANLVTLRDITKRRQADEVSGAGAVEGLYYRVGAKERFDVVRLISTLSSRFIHATAGTIDAEITRALASIGTFSGAERSSTSFLSDGRPPAKATYGWCAEGVGTEQCKLHDLPKRSLDWLMRRLEHSDVIPIPSAAPFLPESTEEQEFLTATGVRSMLIAPIRANTHLLGLISLEAVTEQKAWTGEDGVLLKLAGEMISCAFEHKQTEEALRASEYHFRALIEKTSDFIQILDGTGTITFVSPSIEWIDGLPPEKVIGRSAFEMMIPEDVPRAIEVFKDLIQHPGKSITFDVRFEGPRGMHWIETVVTNLLEDPHVNGIVVNGRDSTDRKRAQEALAESEEKYRKLIELAPDAVLIHRDGKILYANSAGVKLFGASSPGDLIGRAILDTIHPDYRAQVLSFVQRELQGEMTPLLQHKALRLDGTSVWVEGRGVRTIIDGRPATQVIVRDISDRKKAEDDLRKSENRYRTLFEEAPISEWHEDFSAVKA